jgi:polyhydroxyalkanoate synthesis repressor PhaR
MLHRSKPPGLLVCLEPLVSVSSQAKRATPNEEGGLHIIKKYPNRRLYDTQTSSYVTLAEVKQLVLKARPFAVRDAKTGEDLTRSILLQIILEEEAAGVPLFSEQALANIIRFYGHASQSYMGSMLDSQLNALAQWQTRLGEQSAPLMEQMQKQTEQMWGAFGLKL